MAASEIEQIAKFQERFARAQATDVIDLPWGFVLLNRDFPKSHDHNRVVIKSTAPSAEILSAVDEVLGGANLQHRLVSVTDEALGLDLSAAFLSAGFEREMLTTMIYRGVPADLPMHDVVAVSVDSLRPAFTRDWKVMLPESDDEVHAQLADRTRLYDRGAQVDRLVVYSGTQIAARLDVFIDTAGGIAQLENLFTHPDFRSRGYADSLIREGLRRGQRAKCGLSFLVADLEDWPHTWYTRLGFVETHRSYDFTKVG